MNIIKGNIVDVVSREIFKGEILFSDKIEKITRKDVSEEQYILPGFVNSHMHIESSMLSPVEFAKQAVKHGTVAIVTDPHEIANVCGVEGINYMIKDAKNAAVKIFFGAPSCVPATTFETSGNVLDSKIIDGLLQKKEIYFLSEMMDFPGVVNDNTEVHEKLRLAKKYGKPVDGHAPGINGSDLKKYIRSGISTDHECFTIREAENKLALGMKIQIREGSAAKNFEQLFPLIDSHPESVMICTDDSHPDDLIHGHINLITQRAWNKGLDYFNVLRCATINPVLHYSLPVGYLQTGQYADFIVASDKFGNNISSVFINGTDNLNDIENVISTRFALNNFNACPVSINDLSCKNSGSFINIISIQDGELITKREKHPVEKVFSTEKKIKLPFNKIVVLNRYEKHAKPVIGAVENFNINNGAIASSIAHDSHNIICIGANDKSIADAINLLIKQKGGIVALDSERKISHFLPLEIGGLMTSKNAEWVAKKYQVINDFAKKELGTTLYAPFMTMSFLSLLVIPELKIGDKGLFDIRVPGFVNLFENE